MFRWAAWELEIWPRQISRSFTPTSYILTAWPSGLRLWFFSLLQVRVQEEANYFFFVFIKKYVLVVFNIFFDIRLKKREERKKMFATAGIWTRVSDKYQCLRPLGHAVNMHEEGVKLLLICLGQISNSQGAHQSIFVSVNQYWHKKAQNTPKWSQGIENTKEKFKKNSFVCPRSIWFGEPPCITKLDEFLH